MYNCSSPFSILDLPMYSTVNSLQLLIIITAEEIRQYNKIVN